MRTLWITFNLIINNIGLSSRSTATPIKNVTLVDNKVTSYAAYGILAVKYENKWIYTCYYGEKNWGKPEATTSSKQLGYRGGWPDRQDPKEQNTTLNLINVDCNENLSDLNDCYFETTESCRDSKVAEVLCYKTFTAHLVDGKTPNIGKVQVTYDDVLSDVCYTRETSARWSFYNTQVLCRELGFPGAMFDKKRTDEIEGSLISGYECRDDLREESLQDCNPDMPYKYKGIGDKAVCSGVTVACSPPGYIGCYDISESIIIIDPETRFESTNMTINECRRSCRKKVDKYAYLSAGSTCWCSSEKINGKRISDIRCNMTCAGNNNEVCGTNNTVSVYDVSEGLCIDPFDADTVYFFGELFTPECPPGTKPSKEAAVQCVLNDDFKVAWNSSKFPECKEMGKNERGLKIIFGTGIPLFALICICVGLVLGGHFKRPKTPPRSDDNYGSTGSSRVKFSRIKSNTESTASESEPGAPGSVSLEQEPEFVSLEQDSESVSFDIVIEQDPSQSP